MAIIRFLRGLLMGERLAAFGHFTRVYLACLLAVSTAMLVVKADPPVGTGNPGVFITSPSNTVTVGGDSFNPTLDLNTASTPTWSATQTFPNIIDSGVGPGVSCIATNASSQLTAGTCANPANSYTWGAGQTFPAVFDTGILPNTTCIGTDAASQLVASSCPGGGDTITSPGASLTVGGTATATTLDLATTQSANYTWNGVQTFQGGINYIEPGPTPCTGTPSTLFTGICIAGNLGTATTAILLGPVVQSAGGMGCISACSASDSMRLCFSAQHASGGPTTVCDYQTNGGTRVFGCSAVCSDNNTLFSTGPITHGSGACSGTSPVTSAAGVWDCRVTSASSTATLNFGTAFTAEPNCSANDKTAAAALKVVGTTTSVTVTGQGASDVIYITCLGNG